MSHLEDVREHYEQALRSTGDSGRRVGLRDTAAQTARFNSFLRLMTGYSLGSVADIGCGTADLLSFLRSEGWAESYVGVDISPGMIEEATEKFRLDSCSRFLVTESLPRADFLIASGVFKVSLRRNKYVIFNHRMMADMVAAPQKNIITKSHKRLDRIVPQN